MAHRFARGDTIRISTETVDYTDVPTTPGTSMRVSILKGSTVVLAPTPMTLVDVGKHYYRWQSLSTSDPGKYEVKVTAVHEGYTSVEHDEQAFYLY